ncbi:erlin (er lipid raft associated protein) [Anaeramoeba ignava]|uniref:Erlin (Er lipid raft associated protein) n=1 Tax=Anaeramoeba ignava TaxID=1746090 RepID=A0A9Q0L8A4_ANAIG|nr:erlin (er lipid raft associated protein) [Anaeramoeba ignava]
MAINLIGIILSFSLVIFLQSFHQVEEGTIGLYWRGGALLKGYDEPGLHLKLPFITRAENIPILVQTEYVTNISCGTSGGALLKFERVEVVNRLKKELVWETVKNYSTKYSEIWIHNIITQEINDFCSLHTLEEVFISLFDTIDDKIRDSLEHDLNNWAPGIEIISVRVTKPLIPVDVASNYEKIELKKLEIKIEEQLQKISQTNFETSKIVAKIQAEEKKEVSQIQMQKQIAEIESQKIISEIEDETTSQRIPNLKLYSPQFLTLKMIEGIPKDSEVHYGPNVKNIFKLKIEEKQN